uniref:Major facilitator superfamily (MFS) profile domain-containing protein n=1 Tax=Caenorhabditis japonica TaxID=281687 RepID=A0A8R1IN92_CAEJA
MGELCEHSVHSHVCGNIRVGPGPIPWFFTSELFDSATRGKAAAVSASSNWIANWLVGLTFLPINNLIHQFAFLMFTFFTFVFILFTWKFVPETKGRTPTAIRKELTVMKKRVF